MLTKPAQYPQADVLVTESTYGDRKHPPRKDTVKEFVAAVENTLEAGGIALLPAFAVGRGQEIIMTLEKLDYPIYLDGMGTTVCNIFSYYPEFLRDFNQYERAIGKSIWLRRDRDRKKAVRQPSIIVSSAGMLTGGPVLQHLKRLYKSPTNSVILTGFQVEGTNGRRLVNEGVVYDDWSQRNYNVKCRVMQFDFSAHSDQDELGKTVKQVDPELVVCMHGEESICEALAERLRAEGREAKVPKTGEVVEV